MGAPDVVVVAAIVGAECVDVGATAGALMWPPRWGADVELVEGPFHLDRDDVGAHFPGVRFASGPACDGVNGQALAHSQRASFEDVVVEEGVHRLQMLCGY